MRDIGSRIQRYRLSRYALPVDHVGSKLRWAWLLAALWLVWVGFVSEHNFYRLLQLSREQSHSRAQLAAINSEVARLTAQVNDPATRRRTAEDEARKRGMARKGEIVYRIDAKGSSRAER